MVESSCRAGLQELNMPKSLSSTSQVLFKLYYYFFIFLPRPPDGVCRTMSKTSVRGKALFDAFSQQRYFGEWVGERWMTLRTHLFVGLLAHACVCVCVCASVLHLLLGDALLPLQLSFSHLGQHFLDLLLHLLEAFVWSSIFARECLVHLRGL